MVGSHVSIESVGKKENTEKHPPLFNLLLNICGVLNKTTRSEIIEENLKARSQATLSAAETFLKVLSQERKVSQGLLEKVSLETGIK
jgi:hypothetical protein